VEAAIEASPAATKIEASLKAQPLEAVPGLSARAAIDLPDTIEFSMNGLALRVSLPAGYRAIDRGTSMKQWVNGDAQKPVVVAILGQTQQSLASAKELHTMTGSKVMEAEDTEDGWRLVVSFGVTPSFTSEVVRNIGDSGFTCSATSTDRSALDAAISACMTLTLQSK